MAQVSFNIRRYRRLALEDDLTLWSDKQRIQVFSLLAQTMNDLEYWTSENHGS
jgi:hypothetical protein